MGIGPRKKDNDVRDRQGKMVNPKGSVSMTNNDVKGNHADSGGGGTPNKQYNQKGPKYTGPNYPQKDTNVVPFGGK